MDCQIQVCTVLKCFPDSAVRAFVNMPRANTDLLTTPKVINLHFLSVKARIEFKICFLAHTTFLSTEPRYIKNLLQAVMISSFCRLTSSGYTI